MEGSTQWFSRCLLRPRRYKRSLDDSRLFWNHADCDKWLSPQWWSNSERGRSSWVKQSYYRRFGYSGWAGAARMGFGNKEDEKVTANPGCEGGSVDLEICLRPNFMVALEADLEL
ncbi:UDP-3-O-acylglucosamine N-acyltransferase [Bienertia sinuspersici]